MGTRQIGQSRMSPTPADEPTEIIDLIDPDEITEGPEPETAHEHRFRVVLRGYDRGAVDLRMRALGSEIETLQEQLRARDARIAELSEVRELSTLDEDELLVIASQEIAAMVNSAKARAARIVAESEQRADAAVFEAERRATAVVNEAETARERMLDEARSLTQELLSMAESEAEELEQDARSRASATADASERRRVEAEAEAARLVESAKAQAQQVLASATDRVAEMQRAMEQHQTVFLTEVQKRRDAAHDIFNELTNARTEFVAAYHAVGERLDHALVLMAGPVEIAHRYLTSMLEVAPAGTERQPISLPSPASLAD